VDALSTAGALALAAVFAVAAATKLLDREGSSIAMRSFGVPDRLAGIAARLLPIVEIAIAALLLPVSTRGDAAVAALVLLLAFCAAIARAVARGEAPECHCFGQLHSAPAGWRTLGRNLALAALAALVVATGRDDTGPSVFAWTGRLERAEWLVLALAVVLAVVIAVAGSLLVHVLRGYGRVLGRLERLEGRLRDAGFDLDEPDDVPRLGLEPGTAAPAFWLPSVEGDRVALGDLLEPGRPALLLFTSPTCGPCTHLLPTVAAWQAEHGDELTVVLVSSGDAGAVRAEAAEHGLANVLLDEGMAAYEAYGANGTPSAVLVADDGTIAAWLAAGSEWIETLVEQALGGLGRTPGLPVGSEVPEELATLVDRETVVLFWNPGCGFCRAMREDLLGWEASPPAGAPGLLLVASGDAHEVREDAFRSPVVLDPEWELSGRLGAEGTPTAVLVGADRRIASPLVTRGEAILQLLGAEVAAAA
jgi:methylamine dehydrogenase accessory protein MauD